MTSKPLPAQLTICRSHGPDGDTISIYIHDESSGTEAVDLCMTEEAFGHAVTGGSRAKCMVEWRTDNIGKTAESKTEEVPIADLSYNKGPERDAIIAKALEPFQVDGWFARAGDIGNHHRRTKNGYNVVFFRYV